MERFVKGDVVVLPFPYTDLSTTKKRPALIVATLKGENIILAQITTKQRDDEDMLTCKFGSWWEINPQRGRANNSAVLLRNQIDKETFNKVKNVFFSL